MGLLLDYNRLMNYELVEEGTMTNSLGQTITFIEDPTQVQGINVICVCHDLEFASYSSYPTMKEMLGEGFEPTFDELEEEFQLLEVK